MKKLTIQALLDQSWFDIAELTLLEPKLGSASASELAYEYAQRFHSTMLKLN
jgi:serine/threonine-protein kinase HipA